MYTLVHTCAEVDIAHTHCQGSQSSSCFWLVPEPHMAPIAPHQEKIDFSETVPNIRVWKISSRKIFEERPCSPHMTSRGLEKRSSSGPALSETPKTGPLRASWNQKFSAKLVICSASPCRTREKSLSSSFSVNGLRHVGVHENRRFSESGDPVQRPR